MVNSRFRVLAREDGYVVVDKAPGLDVHDCLGEPGLCSLVRVALGAPVLPVHRLDKPTSGLMLLATERAMAASLAGLFRQRSIEKFYVALTDQTPRKKQGLVSGDMERARRGAWKLCRTQIRPARTRFFSWSVRPGLRLWALRPLTGRTHQLRVALRSLGAPILGDPTYHQRVIPWPDRLYLHAHTLRFVLHGAVREYVAHPECGDLFAAADVRAMLSDLGPLSTLSWPA